MWQGLEPNVSNCFIHKETSWTAYFIQSLSKSPLCFCHFLKVICNGVKALFHWVL